MYIEMENVTYTHNVHIEMENVIQIFFYIVNYIATAEQVFKRNYAKDAHTHTGTHTDTHTVQTDGSEGQCGLIEIFWEEKCLKLTFEF